MATSNIKNPNPNAVLNTDNVTTFGNLSTLHIDVARCRDRIVTISGISDAGSSYNIANVKTEYIPPADIMAGINVISGSDNGKNPSVVLTSQGVLKLTTANELNYGVKYSLVYAI